MLKRWKIKINLFLSAAFIMMVQIKLKAFFFFAEGNGCVPFLVSKIHDQILETGLSHMRYIINNIDWYTVK